MTDGSSTESPIVVFDLGEVLSTPSGLIERLAGIVQRDTERFATAYWQGRDPYDRGESLQAYWRGVLDRLDIGPVPESLITELSDVDSAVWSTIRPAASQILEDLHNCGRKVAILSNAPTPLSRVARTTEWAAFVDWWFFSAELAMAKPDAEIYREVSTRLSMDPGRLVYFDDRQDNVDAARALGWRAFLWRSDSDTRAVLTSLALL